MKKLFTLTILLFSFFAKADYWTQKADFGGVERYGAVGFSIGNKGYIGTGRGSIGVGDVYSDFWEYDPITNVWTQKADLGGVPRCFAAGFSINNKGYIGCGQNSMGSTLNDFWEFDIMTNIWIQKNDFGGAPRTSPVGFAINGKGYLGTGLSNSGVYKDFWEYNPSNNVWLQKAIYGGDRKTQAIGFSNDIKGYLGTGTDTSVWPLGVKDFWQWDPNSNVWTQKANFAGSARSEACAFFICPFGYIGLGTTQVGNGTISDFWKYSISTNSWTQVANFGAGLREMAVAFSIGTKGYVGTGFINDNYIPTIDFWEYTPDSACATGIDELQVSNFDFHISPNPAKDYIIISYPSSGKENIYITITDVTGKIVETDNYPSLRNEIKINLRSFSKGIYFVEVRNDKQKAVNKFIKE